MTKGKTVHIRQLNVHDAAESLRLQTENRDFFEKFSMTRAVDFYKIEGQINMIQNHHEHVQKDQGYAFGIFKNDDDALIGTISLFQVIRGSLQSAFIGYFLDKKHNGKGYATEAVQLICEYAFGELKLHRIEAGVMPHNIASMRVLEKAGFHKEGIAQKNVKIHGKWEDHQVLALINPDD
ncbi:GNAT family N-acetyltransferase [Paenibacillus caui]|uniref:GNAT family N-acetyltransferase n=1 Tax=Paenibacillus caui TaxID=2873927 RepID=UPI001CA98534|nr:GNAT family protein [Paenibacillus caui]